MIVLVILAPDGLAGRISRLAIYLWSRLRGASGRVPTGPPSAGEAR